MLALRPNCEWCDKDLPPDAPDARICSYECTFCARCVEEVLHDVCPTCGGNFAPRPMRPRVNYREGKALGLANHPASTERIHCKWTAREVEAQSVRLRDVAPQER